jgi:Tfp pilus assembly protein PilV
MSASRHVSAAGGMALLEVLVALFLLAVTLLGVGRAQLWSARESRIDTQYEQAHAAARSVAGLLRAGEPADLLALRLARWRQAATASLHDAEIDIVEARGGAPAFVVVRWTDPHGARATAARSDAGTACEIEARGVGRACVALAF